MVLGTIDYSRRNTNEGYKFTGDNQTPNALQTAVMIAGYDGSKTRWLRTNSSGELKAEISGVTFSGDVNVSAFKNQAGTEKDAKVNGADILVMQTGSGTDATTMTEEIATEATVSDILDSLTLDEKGYDTIELTYVAAGNGVGEVETVTYKNGVTTIYTLTLTYNSDGKLESVVRS